MALIALAIAAFAASSASAIGIGKGPGEEWEAGTCKVETCTYEGLSPATEFFAQAAGHPAFGVTNFTVKVDGTDQAKRVKVELPQGLNVNPQSVPQCPVETFKTNEAACAASKVGTSEVTTVLIGLIPVTLPFTVYNLVPANGEPALFGFHVTTPVVPLINEYVFLETAIEWAGDYHESFFINNIEAFPALDANKLKFEGTAGGNFLTLPSPCNGPSSSKLELESQAGATAGPQVTTPPVPIAGCAAVPFAPSVTAAASGSTDSSSTVSVSLNVPQHQAAAEINSSTVKNANVTLPVGTGLNPATATGLEFCKDGQFPLNSRAAISCPEKSQVGTVAIEAPELPAGSLKGPVYLAEQKSREPLSGQEYRIFFNAESARYGVQVREEGKVKANPTTGQLTAEFTNLPHVAFSSATLTFGPTAKHAIPALSSPPLCTNTATSSAVPYSTGAVTGTGTTELKLTTAPGGGACAKTMAERPFTPNFLARPNTFKALTYTPYRLTIDRAEGQQEIKGFNITLPPGATAKLAGIPYCQAKEYSAAEGKTGTAEAEKPSCGKESQIGVAAIQSGTGPEPLKLEGKVYLSGPYKGAPLSIVVITPAVAGPFDLGNVVVHAPLNLNPESGQVSTSAEIPDVFGGVKLDIHQIVVNLNRKEFTLNGTNCKKSSVAGTVQGGGGDPTNSAAWSSYSVSTPSQSEGCKALAFKPGLKLRLFGQTNRAKHPKLKATLTPKEGQANVEVASVALPHAIFLDQSSLGTVCTRPQFAAEACPAKSVYGHAIAYSPLLAQPVEGPVVLRSSNNTLPDMVADLKGQVDVVLDGKIDSYKGGIRTTFTGIPDLPVSKFVLVLPGGKHGLLQNSTNLCAKPVKGILRLVGHNSRRSKRQQKIQTPCKGKGAKKGKKSTGSKHGKKSRDGKKNAKGGGHKQKAKQ